MKEAGTTTQTESVPENFSTYFDTRKNVQDTLVTMPEMRKKVFELNRLQGLTYREIAELLSISEKAVDNHLTKAVKQLKKNLPLLVLLSIYCKIIR
jgi:RNA polymerase sigma-70 factor (ECF subfamily)